MRQTCLCQYLRIECNHSDTLLQLPVAIRERIYRHAGLITSHRLDYGDRLDDDDLDVLLHICLQVRKEVEAFLLKHNTWVFVEENIDESLLSLRGWTPEACARLRDLHIHIHMTSDQHRRNDLLLSWGRIRAWQDAARHLLQHATPGQLRLHVICDVGDDVDKARAVVAPFDPFPGQLEELELCLASQATSSLLTLARKVVTWAQAPDVEEPRRHFPFFKLPPEIRRHIFQYTGLVLPHRNVLWLPDGRGFRRQYIFCECDGTVCRERDIHHNRELYHCEAHQDVEGSFCSKRTSSYSRHCKHEAALSLLLASRALYQEAIAFFYASNRVTVAARRHPEHAISMYDPSNSPSSSQAERDEAWDYDAEETYSAEQITHDPTRLLIKHVGTAALRHLRILEIVLPRTTTKSSLEDKSPIYTEWCEAVDLLAEHCNLAGLTILVHIFTTRRYLSWPLLRTEEIRQTQSLRMLSPLRRLPSLNRLFVLLEWPRHWSSLSPKLDIDTSGMPEKASPGCGIGEHYIPSPDPKLMKEEMELERQIMGEHYDSFAVGKRNLIPSPWLRSDWDYPQD